jgi:uncharacterized membrane protein HdeD (DUF308 family)
MVRPSSESVGQRKGKTHSREKGSAMLLNLLLGVAFLVVGVLLMFVGEVWGILVGIIAVLMGLVLLLRAYRSRATVA